MSQKPENLKEAVFLLAKMLKDRKYAFRGTVSLVLQGLEMNVEDIDILCDKETALSCNSLFKDFLVEEISLKESSKFRSYFGKFEVKGIEVEVMGEWQIKESKGEWSIPFDASERKKINLGGQEIYVTTIDSELAMFAKMGRWTAYQKILKQVRKIKENQLSLL